MCGRYSLTVTKAGLLARFPQAEGELLHTPRYNIAPTQSVPAILAAAPRPRWANLRWGFSLPDRPALINARVETVSARPLFRSWLRAHRCLIPADGFYEWPKGQGTDRCGRPAPVRVVRRDRAPFAFAGLWRPGAAPEAPGECVILTTHPNALMASIHDRMPVIVPPAMEGLWLDLACEGEEMVAMLIKPYDVEALEAYAVSAAVNRVRNDDPMCMAPAHPPQGFERTLPL